MSTSSPIIRCHLLAEYVVNSPADIHSQSLGSLSNRFAASRSPKLESAKRAPLRWSLEGDNQSSGISALYGLFRSRRRAAGMCFLIGPIPFNFVVFSPKIGVRLSSAQTNVHRFLTIFSAGLTLVATGIEDINVTKSTTERAERS